MLHLWKGLSRYPGGSWLFSKIFGRTVRYSGFVAPRIRVLEPGHADVEIPDRRSNRNHWARCEAREAYKQAIADSDEDDIVLTERLTDIPVADVRPAGKDRARLFGRARLARQLPGA